MRRVHCPGFHSFQPNFSCSAGATKLGCPGRTPFRTIEIALGQCGRLGVSLRASKPVPRHPTTSGSGRGGATLPSLEHRRGRRAEMGAGGGSGGNSAPSAPVPLSQMQLCKHFFFLTTCGRGDGGIPAAKISRHPTPEYRCKHYGIAWVRQSVPVSN